MAFTAGIKRPQFNANNNSGNKNQQNNYDRLVTVTAYDTAKGYLYGHDDNGKKYEVFVSPEEFQRSEASLAAKKADITKINWMGHNINKGMEKHVPVGSKVILLRSRVTSNDKTRDLSVTEAHRIIGVPNPDADKTFQGIFTMNYIMQEGKKRVARVQHWNPKAININNGEGLEDLAQKIDEARKNYGVKIGDQSVTEPTIGVQFRALMKTDRPYALLDNRPVFEVVDSSLPFDWIPGPEDEKGNEIKTGAHTLTGEEMMAYAEAYVDYIANHDQFKDNIDDMRVEICYYKVYPASRSDELALTSGDPVKDKNADKNPLYQLTHRVSYVDMANSDDAAIIGRNAAVNGIIQISANKPMKVDGKWVEVPSYWVSRVHANNTRGHVHSFVRSVDEEGVEYKAEPHEALKLVKTEQQINAENAKANGTSNAPARQSEPKPAAVSMESTTLVEDKEFNPFEESGSASDFDIFNNDTSNAPKTSRLSFNAKKEDA
jgi:hypothetical protein